MDIQHWIVNEDWSGNVQTHQRIFQLVTEHLGGLYSDNVESPLMRGDFFSVKCESRRAPHAVDRAPAPRPPAVAGNALGALWGDRPIDRSWTDLSVQERAIGPGSVQRPQITPKV